MEPEERHSNVQFEWYRGFVMQTRLKECVNTLIEAGFFIAITIEPPPQKRQGNWPGIDKRGFV